MLNFFQLAYSLESLSPGLSAETLDFHYNKHHRTYFDNLLKLLKAAAWPDLSLPEIIKQSAGNDETRAIFNNAAQVFNHDFYWQSLSPSKPVASDWLKGELGRHFSSWDDFLFQLKTAGLNHFASGWLWVLWTGEKIEITTTANADTPLLYGQFPLLVIDLWEHAYYIDYRNGRGAYLDSLLSAWINWSFLENNLKKALSLV